MTASYSLRLLFACLASFFLIHSVMCLAVRALEARALRFAEQLTSRAAARLFLLLRVLPAGIAIVLVAALCAPSYLRFEPNAGGERVGLACLTSAFLGLVVWTLALGSGLRSAIHALRFIRACRRSGRVVHLAGEPSELLVVRGQQPFLTQCGILRPDFVISERVLSHFSRAELDAALGHERAHWLSRDNLKRLVLRFLPAIIPFSRGFAGTECGWAKFTERAADDFVSARGPGAALSLASALVRLARMRATTAQPLCVPQAASSLRGSDDLSGRVHRLLAPSRVPAKASAPVWVLCSAGGLLVAGCVGVLVSPTLLMSVHQVVERLLH
jgi:Zn-dependent protease with chaperone function